VARPEWRRFSAPDWRAEPWSEIEAECPGELEFSSVGYWISILSNHRSQITIWDRRGRRLAAQKNFDGMVTTTAFAADENWLFVVAKTQNSPTQIHRFALRSGLEDEVLTSEMLHFKRIVPHPDNRLLAAVDNYGVLVVIDVETMRVVNQVWIKETNSLLPEALREPMISDAMEKMMGVLTNHISAAQLEEYNRQCARHFLPKEAIHVCSFSADGKWLFCGTRCGLRGLDWSEVLRCPNMQAVPVQLSVDAEGVSLDEERDASAEHKLVYAISFDVIRQRVLFSGLEGKISFLNLKDGRAGTLLAVPGRVPLFQLALMPDRSAIAASGHRLDYRSNKRQPPHFQIWNYPALCRAAGLEH